MGQAEATFAMRNVVHHSIRPTLPLMLEPPEDNEYQANSTNRTDFRFPPV